MHIAVLAKVVPDYAVPSSDFELVNNRPNEKYTRMIGLYDENAIETGVQLKEKYGATLTIISYGRDSDVAVLRKALAMGADRLVLITGESDDAHVVAADLKQAIEKLENADLILAGQQSADMDRGLVHGLTAGMMGVPFIPQVSRVSQENGAWTVEQIMENGVRELNVVGKAVLSITSIPENIPRIPAVKAIFAAKKKPVEKMGAINGIRGGVTQLSVDIPKVTSVCEMIPADDPSAMAQTLLKRLREERYL
jgi:electron transfer flavoprotein beta subunit